MNDANKNNEAEYISLLCIQPYEEPPPAMALVGCERSGRTAPPPKKHQKSVPSCFTLFLHNSVATNQLARAKDSCDERRRCASMRENAFYDFVRAVFV